MTDSNSPLFYGWKIVFAILAQLTITSGLSFYNHAIYLTELAANPNFDVQTASFAVSLFFLSGGITGLWVGVGPNIIRNSIKITFIFQVNHEFTNI